MHLKEDYIYLGYIEKDITGLGEPKKTKDIETCKLNGSKWGIGGCPEDCISYESS